MTDEQVEGQEPETEEATDSFDREYVEGLRGEAAKYRTKLRDTQQEVESLTSKLKKFEDAQKSELERLTEEKAELERRAIDLEREMTESAIQADIKIQAAKLNIIDPEAAVVLIDRNDITYDEGKVTGVDKALKKLLKEKPYLTGEDKEVPPPTPGVGDKPLDGSDVQGIDGAFLGMMKGAQK